jgi:hypothetical protein
MRRPSVLRKRDNLRSFSRVVILDGLRRGPKVSEEGIGRYRSRPGCVGDVEHSVPELIFARLPDEGGRPTPRLSHNTLTGLSKHATRPANEATALTLVKVIGTAAFRFFSDISSNTRALIPVSNAREDAWQQPASGEPATAPKQGRLAPILVIVP